MPRRITLILDPTNRFSEMNLLQCHTFFVLLGFIKGVGRSADLKINKSDPLPLNHHIILNTEPIYTK